MFQLLLSAFYLIYIIALNVPIGRYYYFCFTNDETEVKHLLKATQLVTDKAVI